MGGGVRGGGWQAWVPQVEKPVRQTGLGGGALGRGLGRSVSPGYVSSARAPERRSCPEEQMAGAVARPGEQAHLRGGYREQAHDGGLGGPAQGAVAVTEGTTDNRQHGNARRTEFPSGPGEG